ncbi:ABC transporter ATP-binding protein [Candidatus Aciduliprofundum boonei]|uniref:ABC transporter related protein n=1 Tax=Aciduliprofundum boonei (strain DSM 19572 / T469) TaxID=439481 RepID=D3TB11_ACIB4|nr:ABC transporter ATP-binding protein [Candidatus Aciduliprofundum boonei]ADD09290.1 ABC transporter related protein [Aciduliprofundum boonei T469]HII55241.1 ABC transporter ATP-binding protein [Candidatus Aciduliprofundum boonei]
MHLQALDIHKHYGKKPVLRGASLNVERGDIVMIRGQSGIGKTTFLNIISGIDLPDKGRVIIDSKDITKMSENERAKFRLHKIGLIFQSMNLIEDLSVIENIALPLKLAGKKWKKRVNELLQYLNIENVKHSFPTELSGGEMQRVAIARAIANEPEILVADEPTSNLDDENTENIVNLLRKINKEMNMSIIIATHDPRMENLDAKRFFMKEGKLYEG